MTGLVVAVDGGGSKTHAVALELDGTVAGRATGAGSSPQLLGVVSSIEVVDAAVRSAVPRGREVAQANLYLSGLDLEPELVAYSAAVAALPWAPDPAHTVVDNDLFALLRSGTREPDAVAVVCGTGINAVGVRADGATARFPALGPISGDWGGGSGLGEDALWHAARAEDGRGPATALREVVLAGTGTGSVAELIEDLHFGRRSIVELARLAPGVFEAARAGDAVAGSLVDRQGDEVVAFARAALGRLGLTDRDVPVVLGGGVIRARDRRLMSRIEAGLAADLPQARAVVVDAHPILGAALLALESAGADLASVDRAEAMLQG